MVLQDVKTALSTHSEVPSSAGSQAPSATVNNSASEIHNSGTTDESALVRELAPLANEADKCVLWICRLYSFVTSVQ